MSGNNDDNDREMSRAEVAEALGCSRQLIRHIEERALSKLRRTLVIEREVAASKLRNGGKR